MRKKAGKRRWRLVAMLIAVAGLIQAYDRYEHQDEVKAASVVAAELDYAETLPGQAVNLQIKVEGARGAEVKPFAVPDGLSVSYQGPSTQFSWVNGRTSYTVTHIYSIMPTRAGVFTLGPFIVEAGGREYRVDAVRLTVSAGTGGQVPPAPGQSSPDGGETDQGLGHLVFLEIEPGESQAYVGQEIPIALRLYVAEEPVIDNVQMPTLETANLMIEPFGQPARKRVARNGRQYDVLEFTTKAYPLVPGRMKIGPARLSCELLSESADPFGDGGFFPGFFGRRMRQPLTLTAKAAPLLVRPLPAEGKPADYSGGIGDFQLQASAAPSRVKLGDPVTLTIEVAGRGNLARIKPPFLTDAAGFKVYPPQRSAAQPREGTIRFEQVVIPLDPGVKEIPPVRLAYFDPARGAYTVKETSAFPLAIKGGDRSSLHASRPELFLGSERDSQDSGVVGYDLVYLHDRPGRMRPSAYRLYKEPAFWFLPGFLICLTLANGVFLIRREKLYANSPRERWRRARMAARAELGAARELMRRGQAAAAADRIFRAVQGFFAIGLARPAGGVTESIADELACMGLGADFERRVREFFAEYGSWRYAGQGDQESVARRLLDMAEEIIAAARLGGRSFAGPKEIGRVGSR